MKQLYSDYQLKKLTQKFAKSLPKKYDYLDLYIDYFEDKDLGVGFPLLIIGIPDDLEIKDSQKFMSNLGNLLEESGDLTSVCEMFLLSVEYKSVLEERLENANV